MTIGIEPATHYDVLKALDTKIALGIIEVPVGTSRVHASRRVFQLITERESELAFVHSLLYDHVSDKDELILRSGTVEIHYKIYLLTDIENFK